MMTEINLELKKRFDLFHEMDRHVAQCRVTLYVESLELGTLNLREKILMLSKELQRLKQEADTFTRKEYLMFAPIPNCLYNVFYSHCLIFQCDEEPLLLEGLIIFKKLKCISHLLSKAKKKWPSFSYVDFSEGKENILLYELDERPRDMSQNDYYKILNRCIQKRGECANLEFEKIRERFIETIGHTPRLMETVRSTIQLVDEVFEKSKPLTSIQLHSHLSKLTGLMPDWLLEDMDEFHRLFYQFEPQKHFYHALSPQLIQLAHEQISEGIISPVPVCYLSLIKFKRWLATVLKGEIDLNASPDSHDRRLVKKCHETSIEWSKTLMLFFQMENPYGNFTRDQYKSILLAKLKKCRKYLKEFKFPEYYYLLDNTENPHQYVIDQCWLDIFEEDHCCEMGQAIVLHEMIKFYMDKLSRIDQSLVNPTLNMRQMKKDFKVIISIMVPSPGIIERLWRAFNDYSQAVNSQKTFLFIVEDLKDIIDEIFREAIKDLINLLETQPGRVIETYAKRMLTELEQRSLITPEFGQGMDNYVRDLKRLSEMKLKCSCCEQSSPLENSETPYSDLQKQQIKAESTILLAFTYNNKKGDNFSLVHKTLLHLKAIPQEVTLSELREFANGQECKHPIKWLAGQGDLMVFIKEATSNGKLSFPYQQQWNIAVRCFVQADGSNFNVTVLKASRPTDRAAKFMKAANHF